MTDPNPPPRRADFPGVREYLAALSAAGYLYHLDDDPLDIWGDGPRGRAIAADRLAVWAECDAAGIDPFDLYPQTDEPEPAAMTTEPQSLDELFAIHDADNAAALREEDARLAARLAAMTPEERARYDAERRARAAILSGAIDDPATLVEGDDDPDDDDE